MRSGCHSNHLIDIFVFSAFVPDRCGQIHVLEDCEDEGVPIYLCQCVHNWGALGIGVLDSQCTENPVSLSIHARQSIIIM